MSRIKYYYDTEKCKYERVQTSVGDVVLNILGFLSLSLIFAFVGAIIYFEAYPSPQVVILETEIGILGGKYDDMKKDLTQMKLMSKNLQERDINVYRVITGADELPPNFHAIGGAKKYNDIQEVESKDLIVSLLSKIDSIKADMVSQTVSYDEILKAAKRTDEMMLSIPAITPVSVANPRVRVASGFGVRFHPILKVWRQHKGIDFAGPVKTDIVATGDGIIKQVKTNLGGYGKVITIDHGFGYVTRYAHLSAFKVKKGDKVKRGQVIGLLGTTGRSTGPHVHYEVILRGIPKNPVHYFFQDMDPEMYKEILEKASEKNQSLS